MPEYNTSKRTHSGMVPEVYICFDNGTEGGPWSYYVPRDSVDPFDGCVRWILPRSVQRFNHDFRPYQTDYSRNPFEHREGTFERSCLRTSLVTTLRAELSGRQLIHSGRPVDLFNIQPPDDGCYFAKPLVPDGSTDRLYVSPRRSRQLLSLIKSRHMEACVITELDAQIQLLLLDGLREFKEKLKRDARPQVHEGESEADDWHCYYSKATALAKATTRSLYRKSRKPQLDLPISGNSNILDAFGDAIQWSILRTIPEWALGDLLQLIDDQGNAPRFNEEEINLAKEVIRAELVFTKTAADILEISTGRLRTMAGEGRVGAKVDGQHTFMRSDLHSFKEESRPTGKPLDPEKKA